MTMKPFEIKKIIKLAMLIAAGALAFFFIPVPSAKTPHARMPLNDTINCLSAKITEAGVHAAFGNRAKTHIDGACLDVCIYSKNHVQPRLEKLTFEFDNIFALGIRALAFSIVLILFRPWQTFRWRRAILAVVGGVTTLLLAIFIRDFLFGAFLAQTTAITISNQFDDPIRYLIILITLPIPLLIYACKGKNRMKYE